MPESALPRSNAASSGPRSAIVLAGRRSGDDPLALAAGAPHRALLEIEGEPMLLRVVRRLLAQPGIERLLVNIDAPDLLEGLAELTRLRERGVVEIMTSTPSPSESVLESLAWADLSAGPVLVTTADHALLDEAILAAFLDPSARSEADLTIGLVPRQVIQARFPDAQRTYLRFREGAYSGANLFLFRTPKAMRAAAFWRRVEAERKQPWRLARAFGLVTLALFLTRRLSLDQALARASKVVEARLQAVRLPIAEAAVDVDKMADLELVRRILAERRSRHA